MSRKFTKYPKQAVTASKDPGWSEGAYRIYQNSQFIKQTQNSAEVRQYVAQLSDNQLDRIKITRDVLMRAPEYIERQSDVTKFFVDPVRSRRLSMQADRKVTTSSHDGEDEISVEDVKEAAAAHNYTGNIEEEIAELGGDQEQLYMIYDDIVNIGTEVAQKNLGSWRWLLPSETEFDEPVISTDSGYYVVCARGSIQLVPIEAEALFGEEEFDEFDEEGGPTVTASTDYSQERTESPFNVFEKTIGEYAAERGVTADEAQEWFEKIGEPVTHVFEAWNSPFVGLRGESGAYYFSESFEESYPVKMQKLSREEMLKRLKDSVGYFGNIDETLEDSPPDYFVKSSTAGQGDVNVSDLADLMRASWESVNAEWGNSAEDLLEWQDAFYVDEGYRNCVAETAIENIPRLSNVNMSQVHIEADEDENSGELLFTIQIDGTSVGKVRTWYVADRYDASVEPV